MFGLLVIRRTGLIKYSAEVFYVAAKLVLPRPTFSLLSPIALRLEDEEVGQRVGEVLAIVQLTV